MEDTGTLKRASTLPIEDLEDDNCSSKKAKILKEFPLNRHGSSNESQYIVLSQNDEVIDQSTLEYSVKDFLSDDDQSGSGDEAEDEVEEETEDKTETEDKKADNKTEENSDKTDVDWDSEVTGDVSPYHNSTLNNSNTLQDDDINEPLTAENDSGSTIPNQDEQVPGLSKIESVYRDAKVIQTIISEKDLDKIYDKLAEKRSNPNRLDVVTSELLEEPDSTTTDDIFQDVKTVLKHVQYKSSEAVKESDILTLLRLNEKKKNRVDIVIQQLLVSLQAADLKENSAEKSTPKDIFDEVQAVVSKCPKAEPDEIYTLLEEHFKSSNRVQKVIEILKNRGSSSSASDTKTKLEHLESDPDNPLTKNDPIYQDMRVISKMFPEKDRNEIYAFLEAHHNKKDRIQVVIEELLGGGNNSQDDIDGSKPFSLTSNRSHGEFENLCEIFPDCDPNYIFEQLEENAADPDRMNKLAARMFESRNYPKLKEVLDKQQKFTNKRKFQNMVFNMEDFLKKFPDPVTFFENNEKAMSANYKDHVLIQIKNDYPQLKDGYVKEVLERHKHNLIKSLHEINDELNNIAAQGRRSKKLRTVNRMTEIPLPEVPEEFFFNELLYSKHELEIKMHLKKKEEEKKLRIEEARKKGELYECGCCFDDEVLFENMATCADGHLFCKECIRRSTEAAIGDAKVKFPCLTGSCEHDIPLSTLQNVVPPNLFSNILRKLQEEELRLADIPDLVSCPYCSFATVMPDPNDKIFKCLNPECLKETCRFCQEPNHVPLKCNEVEKKTETDMRTYIENKISESMLRTCNNCKKRFFKDFGCNKMTCTCGTTMCYVCREPNIDYDHFNENGGCANENDVNSLHRREMEKAAEDARQQYINDHPELAGLELKYDPKKLVEEMRTGLTGAGVHDDGYDDDEDPDDYEDDEDYY